MFRQLKNIDSAFRHIRLFSFLFILACLAISCFALYKSYEMVKFSQQRIYILANGKAIEALSADRKDNIPVEARDHIQMFHYWFFTLDPDDKVIQEHIGKALYLADQSARNQYDNLREQGYYQNLISANISQQITVDSVMVDIGIYPYAFTCYATQKLIRSSAVLTRSLVTKGVLRNVSRSDHNPHGFLIERWETLENRDRKEESR